jgi:hypothetical protein
MMRRPDEFGVLIAVRHADQRDSSNPPAAAGRRDPCRTRPQLLRPPEHDFKVDGMTPTVREAQNIDKFFDAISYKMDGYLFNTFSYMAVRNGNEFCLRQGRLYLNTGSTENRPTHFQSEHIRAGTYAISELQLSVRGLVKGLVSGSLSTPHGELRVSPNEGGNFSAIYDPLHPDGQATQSRFDTLTILGGPVQLMSQPTLDWELKASPTPYDNLQELALEYPLGPLREVVNVDVVAFNVALIDATSTLAGTSGKLAVILAFGLVPEHVALGYRVFSGGRVVKRSVVRGTEMQWVQGEKFQHGRTEIEVPPAALLHCVVSYHGIAQHHFWVADPTTAPNAKRVVYEVADIQLQILNDMLTKSQSRGAARELETGVAWLLWMLGFSVAHLGSTPRTQDAVDLIATTPNGNFAVIECTTGLLKADHKLPRVVERAEIIRRRLVESGNRHLRVLAVIVTSKTRSEIIADIEQAERLKVLVITREDLEQSLIRTLLHPNAEQVFEQGEQAVQAAAAKYEAQLSLPSPPVSDA